MQHADQVQCPTLFILGARDIMTAARAGKEMASIIPQSRVVLLNGTGHALMMERPNDVLDALIEIV
jgi:pimeloyl-ACP methyl ester carboxylesterase